MLGEGPVPNLTAGGHMQLIGRPAPIEYSNSTRGKETTLQAT
jgi:hypothetical protein